MGTNYYLYPKKACECCGREFDRLHIGKSSAGWCFSLHVMPDDGVASLEDWRRLWNAAGARIEKEGGFAVSPEEMEQVITERRGNADWDDKRRWGGDPEEYFHAHNNSQRGPHGLLRCRVGRWCVGHGVGTWDLIIGEFS